MKIRTKEDADLILAEIAELEDDIEGREIAAREQIRKVEEKLVSDTLASKLQIIGRAEALEAWAKENKGEIFAEGKKSVELTRGTIGFRMPRGRIKLLLAAENVLAKLRAKKLWAFIRTKEEPDLEALWNLSDGQLADLGLKRTKPRDKFFYELKKTEVKNG